MRGIISAVVLNTLVPGTGLVLLGREWLGLLIAVVFGVTGELAALAIFLAPAEFPIAVRVAAAALAAVCWLVGQFFLFARILFLRDPRLPAELAALRSSAEKAMVHGDMETAWLSLRHALAMDHRDAASRVAWARLLTLVGPPGRARRAWRRAAHYDRSRRFRDEIRRGLQQLDATRAS